MSLIAKRIHAYRLEFKIYNGGHVDPSPMSLQLAYAFIPQNRMSILV